MLINKYGVHVALRLFSNRSQMTSKCGKNDNPKPNPYPKLISNTSEREFSVSY